MSDAILVLNAGSSSLKFAVFASNEDTFAPALRGKIAGIGTDPMFSAQDGAGGTVPDDFPPMDRGTGLDRLIPTLLD